MASPAYIRLEIDPPFARLIFDRPDRLNAIDQVTWGAIPALLDTASCNPDVRVLLVSGVDSRAFSTGADINELPGVGATPESADAYSRRIQDATRRLARFAKPSIAVIQGWCIGGGLGIALCCDFRFADDGARFGLTTAKLGIIHTLEDMKRLVDLVGISRAKDILMTGRLFGSDEALSIGLVDRKLAPDALWQGARDYGLEIAARSQLSVRATKSILAEIMAGADEETALSRRLLLESFAGQDLTDGVRAFAERRSPRS